MADLVDAVVVGGGVLGTAITLALARRNLRVLLLEALRPGYGATGSGFAWVNATYKSEDENYFRLNAQGVAQYDRLASEWGAERSGIYGGGALFWTRPEDVAGQARLHHLAQRLQGWNYPVTLLTGEELTVLEPFITPISPLSALSPLSAGQEPLVVRERSGEPGSAASPTSELAALFAPNDKWVDTARLCRLFIEQATLHKAEIRVGSPALGFTRNTSNAISTVETPQGRVSTPLLVLAAGIHTPELVAQVTGDPESIARFPVMQEPGLLVETPPLPAGVVCNRVLYPPDPHGLHLRPTPDGGLLIGADDTDVWLQQFLREVDPESVPASPPVNPFPPDASTTSPFYSSAFEQKERQKSRVVPEARWHDLLERTAQWLPGLPLDDLRARSHPRICIRPVPGDGFPIVGALREVSGTYIAVTHSGITLGPLLADLLATEIFTRLPARILAPYRPERF